MRGAASPSRLDPGLLHRGPHPAHSRDPLMNPTIPGTSAARRPGGSRGRIVLAAGTIVVVIVVVVGVRWMFGRSVADSFPLPSSAVLAGMTVPERIVAIAQSQVGYRTDPADSYCNKYSAYWDAGTANCPNGATAEEWCADFAAWVWHHAGVSFAYGYGAADINGAAASFYEWGVANGEWHLATSGYVPSPGDAAVYGLSTGADPSAAHVAIVTSYLPGQQGPNVVNGDGDRTGFSAVETGTDQSVAQAGHDDSTLTGYVSPP